MYEPEIRSKKLNNENVIATSTCATSQLYVLKIYDLPGVIDIADYEGSAVKPAENGYYHLIDGEFVLCPTWNGKICGEDNTADVCAAHGIPYNPEP